MKKIAVIFRSKTGFTRTYAEWIAGSLQADIYDCKNFNPALFAAYNIIIYGGGLYMSGISGLRLIRRNAALLKGKKIIVFATGCTPLREETNEELIQRNFSPGERQRIKFFYLRGGFNFSKLNLWDKILMTLLKLKIMMKKESKRHPDETGMLAAYRGVSDFSKKRYIQPLIDEVSGSG